MDRIVPLCALFCITGLEIYAISQGMDGVILAGTIAIIAGIGGYTAKTIKIRKQPPE